MILGPQEVGSALAVKPDGFAVGRIGLFSPVGRAVALSADTIPRAGLGGHLNAFDAHGVPQIDPAGMCQIGCSGRPEHAERATIGLLRYVSAVRDCGRSRNADATPKL